MFGAADTEEEAAKAYDKKARDEKGAQAVPSLNWECLGTHDSVCPGAPSRLCRTMQLRRRGQGDAVVLAALQTPAGGRRGTQNNLDRNKFKFLAGLSTMHASCVLSGRAGRER